MNNRRQLTDKCWLTDKEFTGVLH